MKIKTTLRYTLQITAIVLIVMLAILIIYLNASFGNYHSSTFTMIANPFLFLFYMLCSALFLYLRTDKKNIDFIIITPFLFVFTSWLWTQNLHKNVLIEAKLDDSFQMLGYSTIQLFDNYTFEIKIQHPHTASHIKGYYQIANSELHIQEDAIVSLTDSLYAQHYNIIDNQIIEPINNTFPVLFIHEVSPIWHLYLDKR